MDKNLGFSYNVWNICGGSCAECDAHGSPEPCEHGCETHPECPEYVDWIEDPQMSAAEKREKFESLEPVETRSKRRGRGWWRDEIWDGVFWLVQKLVRGLD